MKATSSLIILALFLSLWGKLLTLFCTSNLNVDPFLTLPDEILSEILYLLPAETALSSKRVCTKWRKIISSTDYAETHLRRIVAAPVNFSVFSRSKIQERHFFFTKPDQRGNSSFEKVDVIKPESESAMLIFQLIGSCDGLLLFKCHDITASPPYYLICNPFIKQAASFPPAPTNEPLLRQVYRGKMRRYFYFDIIGFFYDQVTREYKVIEYCYGDNDVKYFIYGLRSKFEKHLCSNTPNASPRGSERENLAVLVSCNRQVCWEVSLVVSGIYQENCLQCVMMFTIDDETLRCIPHPEGMQCRVGEDENSVISHDNMRLFDLDGKLGLGFSTATNITIWRLDDYCVNISWTPCYGIDLGLELQRYRVVCNELESHAAEVLNVIEGELHFWVRSKGLFRRNLYSGILMKSKIGIKTLESHESLKSFSVLYRKSLISPKQVLGR